MNLPERIDLDREQVDALLKRLETGSLQPGDYEIIKAMVETIHLLRQAVDEKAASIRRLLRMLFGDRSEKIENVLKEILPTIIAQNPKPRNARIIVTIVYAILEIMPIRAIVPNIISLCIIVEGMN